MGIKLLRDEGAKPDGDCHYGRFDEQVPTICVDK